MEMHETPTEWGGIEWEAHTIQMEFVETILRSSYYYNH